jgi:hypothetical protein
MFSKYAEYAWNTTDGIIQRILTICDDIFTISTQHRGELTS